MSIRAYQMTEKKPTRNKDARERKVRQKKLGDGLRQLYDDVTSEPIPDDFMKLLEDADKSEGDE